MPDKKISRNDLDFIKKGITFYEVKHHFGEPNRDKGSGIHLFEYDLNDGGTLVLSFADLDYLLSATIIEQDGTQAKLVSIIRK